MQTIYFKVKDHFERYTNADVVFVSGGKLFLTRSAAESYGAGDVKPVKRNNIESLLYFQIHYICNENKRYF